MHFSVEKITALIKAMSFTWLRCSKVLPLRGEQQATEQVIQQKHNQGKSQP
jgi:hypothetical protein